MRKIWIRCGVLLAIVLALGLAHAPLLRLAARPLVDEQPAGDAAFLCIEGSELGVAGDPTLEAVAAWFRADPARRILLLEPWPQRTVELRLVPSFEQMARRGLARQGVPGKSVVTLRGSPRDDWQHAEVLGKWLARQPDVEVVWVADRFQSNRMRYVLRRMLDPAAAARVRILALAAPEYDETNWWRSRCGLKGFLYGWLWLAYAWGEGDAPAPPLRRSVRQYESLLAETYGRPP